MKPIKVVFPQGPCDQKTRYLILGFERLGIPVEVPGQGPKIGVTPFSVHYDNSRVAVCGHDIGCLEKNHLSRGRGESHTWWDGKEGIFFFKVHANPALLSPENRIFPMPQALGRNEFMGMVAGLRKLRAQHKPRLDLFGSFMIGGLRAAACLKIKTGPWKSLVGIGTERKRSAEKIPPGVFLARLASTAYFRTMSTAEIAVSLPSHGTAEGPWCSYRNIEAWALGVPVLTIRPQNYFTFKAPEPGCWIEMAEDLSDLPDVISRALADKGKLEEMGQAAARYFDENFTPEQHARYVLGTIEKCLTPA